MAYSFKPKTPPSGADFSALVKKVNELATKAGIAPLSATVTAKIPVWKRWVGSEKPDYDGAEKGGLQNVVKANAYALDGLKGDHDNLADRVNNIDARLRVVEEAPAARPFP